jgi:hypothetical protein
MYDKIEKITRINEAVTLILNNGYETRAVRGVELLHKLELRVQNVILLRYSGEENQDNYKKIVPLAKDLVSTSGRYEEIDSRNIKGIERYLENINAHTDRIICDISGLSRTLILRLLSLIYYRNLKFSLVYTEAKEYYPRKEEFQSFLNLPDISEAFNKLTEYEEAELMYSSNCDVEEIPELPGRIFPNHPVLLIAFLAFKRSRLSSILNQYETNSRILIKTVPIRKDLKWRGKALEIINFDLIDENKNSVVELPTLFWQKTYDFLSNIYSSNYIGYRFNVILSPLGGKMQTVGTWYFAIRNPDVKVVTSIPRKHFPKKYSIGYGHTHLISMDCVYNKDL